MNGEDDKTKFEKEHETLMQNSAAINDNFNVLFPEIGKITNKIDALKNDINAFNNSVVALNNRLDTKINDENSEVIEKQEVFFAFNERLRIIEDFCNIAVEDSKDADDKENPMHA